MRLAALARRLAERAAASEALAAEARALDAGAPPDEVAAASAASPSLYGSVAYWDVRYAAAGDGDSSRDEWCVRALYHARVGARVASQPLPSRRADAAPACRYVGTQPVVELLQAHAAAGSVGVLGCGISALPAALAAAGYARVCAVDASEVAIEVRAPSRRTLSRHPALRRGMRSACSAVHLRPAVRTKWAMFGAWRGPAAAWTRWSTKRRLTRC